MVAKPGDSAAIALPKGGGALRGLGEKFTPDLHTGAGSISVPLAIPRGRNGFEPQINLTYSTGTGNGAFGFGWTAGVPSIARKTSKGLPRYADSDVFILSGVEDLVRVSETGSTTRYCPRTEGLFSRIERHKDLQNDYWEVRTKDGFISLYGTRSAAGVDPATIARPTDRRDVFSWKLTETRDTFGNRIIYDYAHDRDSSGERAWEELYLERVRYADYVDAGADTFLFSVTFEYEGRPDELSDRRAGFEIRTRRRCHRIVMRSHADGNIPIRHYELVYADSRVSRGELAASAMPANGVSMLSEVIVVGYDDNGNESRDLPPLEFGYTKFEPRDRKFTAVRGHDLPAQSLKSADLTLVDLFGNGLPDYLEMNGAVRYWRNLGSGQFDRPREMAYVPPAGLASPGVQIIDADGDGRGDLVVTQPGSPAGYYPLQFGGRWDARSFQRFEQAPTFGLEDTDVRLLDLDGDGITDALRGGSRPQCYFQSLEHGWSHQEQARGLPGVDFSDPRVKWADMTGDGVVDLVLVYDGNLEYWPKNGRSEWAAPISMRNSPRFPAGYDPRRILLGDVDGDGAADLVYVDHTRVFLWLNRSGNEWSAPIEITGTPPVTDSDEMRIIDLLGNGVAGVLWTADARPYGRPHSFFLDFTGGVKPYMLNEMVNHLGGTTRIEYAPSTKYFLRDQKRRETRWLTPLPFPVQVVAKLEMIDHFSRGKLISEFSYHHGYWDGVEREFRGFGRVEQRDTENFFRYNESSLGGPDEIFARIEVPERFSPPMLTKTWFHQGPVEAEHGVWRELDYSSEYSRYDAPMLSVSGGVSSLLQQLPRRVRRDAVRALRGQVLRTETYALDVSSRADRPYTVQETIPGVSAVVFDADGHHLTYSAPAGFGVSSDSPAVFAPHMLTQRTTQWERGDDALSRFVFCDGQSGDRPADYDDFGQPTHRTEVACPRGWRFFDDIPAEPFLASRTLTRYARSNDTNVYIFDRIAEITTLEITNTAGHDLSYVKNITDDDQSLVVVAQRLNFYDGEAFVGLDHATLDRHGAVTRVESLAITNTLLQQACAPTNDVAAPPELPLAMTTIPPTEWPPEYPRAFKTALADRLAADTSRPFLHVTPSGYGISDGTGPYAAGYFAATERIRYDFHSGPGKGLVTARRDPFGAETTIEYLQPFALMPRLVTAATGLITSAEYNFRTMMPRRVIEPNGNEQRFGFDATGLPLWCAVIDPAGHGDAEDEPSTRFDYDFLAFSRSPADRRQPARVRSIRRIHHVNDPDAPDDEKSLTLEAVEYSDGFGRLLQSRAQAEDVVFAVAGNAAGSTNTILAERAGDPLTTAQIIGSRRSELDPPNVIVSGWQTYDNKGRVVEKYEPFYAKGWSYAPVVDAQLGQKATSYYDPRGQVTRTIGPDGSEQRVISGVPGSIAHPDVESDVFEPTPWEWYAYDSNDNAGHTHGADPIALNYQHHWNTPSSGRLDALARTIMNIGRNRSRNSANDDSAPVSDPLQPIEEHTISARYDIHGNVTAMYDALGRRAMQSAYDLMKRAWRTESIDSGIRRFVFDAGGNLIERRSGNGSLILQAFDSGGRHIRTWARDSASGSVTLRERFTYGDNLVEAELSLDDAKSANVLGRVYRIDDEAGRVSFPAHNFKGNLLEKRREVFDASKLLEPFSPVPANWNVEPSPVDWDSPPPLGSPYVTSFTYDGLGRVTDMKYPADVAGARKNVRTAYNRAGALERLWVDDELYVDRIVYNAKAQRTMIAYGNGVMTRYAYDSASFRLVRMRTETYAGGALAYSAQNSALQESTYTFDLDGNILAIRELASASGVGGSDELDRTFVYDALNRLISASGRETDAVQAPAGCHKIGPWDEAPRPTDVTRARAYLERYEYDAAANLTTLRHVSAGATGYTRQLQYGSGTAVGSPESNRLSSIVRGTTTCQYAHDANGNLVGENSERHFAWDHSDRMRTFRTQPGNAEPCEFVQYLYDSAGQRVVKFVRKQGGGYEQTTYIDGVFEHAKWDIGRPSEGENNVLHACDQNGRLAIIRAGAAHPDDRGPAVQYHLTDHLGNSTLVLGGAIAQDASFIDREEFTPYGETTFGTFGKKRYRMLGKERDEESGFYYFGARYYAPWMSRWTNCDPLGVAAGLNLYAYVRNNPVKLVDRTGRDAAPVLGPSAAPDYSSILRGAAANSNAVAAVGPKPVPGGPFIVITAGFIAAEFINSQYDRWGEAIEKTKAASDSRFDYANAKMDQIRAEASRGEISKFEEAVMLRVLGGRGVTEAQMQVAAALNLAREEGTAVASPNAGPSQVHHMWTTKHATFWTGALNDYLQQKCGLSLKQIEKQNRVRVPGHGGQHGDPYHVAAALVLMERLEQFKKDFDKLSAEGKKTRTAACVDFITTVSESMKAELQNTPGMVHPEWWVITSTVVGSTLIVHIDAYNNPEHSGNPAHYDVVFHPEAPPEVIQKR